MDTNWKDPIPCDPYNCSICGAAEEAKYMNNERMIEKKLCFNCNFWDEHSEKANSPESIRINGHHYHAYDSVSRADGFGAGYGGSKFTIKMNDGRVIETQNLWHQGDIPSYFKGRLFDNAVFVQENLG